MATQTTLAFDQQTNLARVSGRIAALVIAFMESHDTFTAGDLQAYVREHEPSAPDSAGRVMRMLRAKGLVNYEVVSRAESKYRTVKVNQ